MENYSYCPHLHAVHTAALPSLPCRCLITVCHIHSGCCLAAASRGSRCTPSRSSSSATPAPGPRTCTTCWRWTRPLHSAARSMQVGGQQCTGVVRQHQATAHPPLGHFAFPHIYPTSTPPHTSAHRLPLLLHLHGSPEAAAVAAAGGAAPDGQYGAELGAASGERRAGCMHLNVNHEGRVGGQRPPTRWTIWSCAGSGRQ